MLIKLDMMILLNSTLILVLSDFHFQDDSRSHGSKTFKKILHQLRNMAFNHLRLNWYAVEICWFEEPSSWSISIQKREPYSSDSIENDMLACVQILSDQFLSNLLYQFDCPWPSFKVTVVWESKMSWFIFLQIFWSIWMRFRRGQE